MINEYPFHTAFLLVLLVIVGIRMYFSGYADAVSGVRQTTKGEGAFRLLRPLLGIPVLAGFLAYAVWPPLMAWSQFPLQPELRWSGLLIAIAGIALLVWVQKHLSRNFTGTVQIRPGGNVVQTGPYKYVRHPMYWSFLLLGGGFFLLTASWFIGGGFIFIILIVMIVRTPIEEQALLRAYGAEYADYLKRTGKFFPKLSAS
jgi:protein-S-isoprenylcysteine O-methyltransferase Ste14